MEKAVERRRTARTAVRGILEAITTRIVDPYEGYQQLYRYWCANSGAVPELRPLFRIPGIEPGGCFEVTNGFRDEVVTIATAISEDFSAQS